MFVSFFDHSIENRNVTEQLPLQEILHRIRNGYWKNQVMNVRNALARFGKESDQYDEAKKQMPNFTTSAQFEGRRKKVNIIEHSGFIDMDIDCYGSDVEAVKEQVAKIPFVAAVYSSVSGKGVCAVCHVPPVAEMHKQFCSTIFSYFVAQGFEGLDYLTDFTRARFVSYDPTAIIKDNFRQLTKNDQMALGDNFVPMVPEGVNRDQNQYYTDEECLEHAWKQTEKRGHVWGAGTHWSFIVPFLLYCNDLGVPLDKLIEFVDSKEGTYSDLKKVARGYYDMAKKDHGRKDRIKSKYVGKPVLFKGEKGHSSYIPKMYDGNVVTELEHYDPIIDRCRISAATKPKFYPRLVMYGNAVVARGGDHVVFSGKSKVGKSALVKRVLAGLLLPFTENKYMEPFAKLWKFSFGMNVEMLPLIYVDTEQSEDDVTDAVKEICAMAGYDHIPDWFIVLKLRDVPLEDRIGIINRVILKLIDQYGGVFGLCLDGTADLVHDVNDIQKVNELYDNLSFLCERYMFPIFHVIHMNPTGFDKERGHLGSKFRRKAATTIRLHADYKNGSKLIEDRFTWVDFHLMRKGAANKFAIRWQRDEGFVRDDTIIDGKPTGREGLVRNDQAKYIAQYRDCVKRIFTMNDDKPVKVATMIELLNRRLPEMGIELSEILGSSPHIRNMVSLNIVTSNYEDDTFEMGLNLEGSEGEDLPVYAPEAKDFEWG